MASVYLQGTDLALFGVPLTSRATIMRASALINHVLRRPVGIAWEPDWAGMPAYMSGAEPFRTLTSQGSILPGVNVIVSLPGTTWDDTILGQPVVMDRLTDGPTEVAWINAYTPGAIVLSQVQQAHTGPVQLDLGMTLFEQLELPTRRSTVMLSQWPIARIFSGLGRYGYGRRSAQETGYFDDVNLLAALSTFGGAPIWEAFDIQSSSLNARTGEYWVPSSLLLSYFTEVRVWYVGGWQSNAIPDDIKVACAAVAQNIDSAAFGPAARRFTTGKIDIQRFSDTVMDQDIRNMLRRYQANVLG